MPTPARVYLDNAATSWPKPEPVYRAVDHFQRQIGASAGRGNYSDAMRSRDILDQTRLRLRQLFCAPADGLFIFAFNGTDALNLALHGLLTEKCHCITTVTEHNSVLRPLRELAATKGIEVSFAECDGTGRVDPAAIERLFRTETRLVAVSHASNVTGALQPLDAIGELARAQGARLLVDAAQSAGHVPIDLERSPIDLLATSGHKGLLGPLGTGFLYLAPGLDSELATCRQGGTGTDSDLDQQPQRGSDKFEVGNPNALGLAGLSAGLEYVQTHAAAHRRMLHTMTELLLHGLSDIPGVRAYGPDDASQRVSVVSFSVNGYACHEVANLLELLGGIQVRAGLMCAPRMHQAMGTPEGLVRVSPGPFNSPADIELLLATLRKITST